MKRKIVSMLLTAGILLGSNTALAEQAKADEYRQIFASGHYYLEYKESGIKKTLAIQDGIRMSYKQSFKGGFNPLSLFVPFALFGGGGATVIPDAYYEAGKYYQFFEKDKAQMATEQELKDPQIDPTENWSTVKLRLALPEAFRMFAGGTDSFDGSTSGVFDFAESYPGDGQEKLPYDKYVRPVRNKGGKVIFEYQYYVYYKDGNISKIQCMLQKPGKKAESVREYTGIKISSDIPKNRITLPKGSKIFKPGMGDMDDLLDIPVPMYTVGEETK